MAINKEKKEKLMKTVMEEVEEAIKEGNSLFAAILYNVKCLELQYVYVSLH